MKIKADKAGDVRYFSAKLQRKEHFDSKEIEILYANTVPALIPPVMVQGKKNNVIRYDISPFSTLEFYTSFTLTCGQFADLLLDCINMFRQLENVYLHYGNLVLDLDKVYVQLGEHPTVHFVYLPLGDTQEEVSIPAFFRAVIDSTTRGTHELAALLDSCLAWMSRPAPFTLAEFAALVQPYAKAPAAVAAGSDRDDRASDRFYHPPAPSGETSALSALPQGVLMRDQTGERIKLSSSPFLIGTEAGTTSYCVVGNTAVSRRHAQIVLQNGVYYIIDQSSTNKTYVNNQELVPLAAQPLSAGDKIRLANEPFTFLLEPN